jgi:hypothetical protein
MPYIKKEERSKFDVVLNELPPITIKGELEYCIYKLMQRYMIGKVPSYTNLHDATYASQHCADEFRRRFLDKREDEAIKVNGDII